MYVLWLIQWKKLMSLAERMSDRIKELEDDLSHALSQGTVGSSTNHQLVAAPWFAERHHAIVHDV